MRLLCDCCFFVKAPYLVVVMVLANIRSLPCCCHDFTKYQIFDIRGQSILWHFSKSKMKSQKSQRSSKLWTKWTMMGMLCFLFLKCTYWHKICTFVKRRYMLLPTEFHMYVTRLSLHAKLLGALFLQEKFPFILY